MNKAFLIVFVVGSTFLSAQTNNGNLLGINMDTFTNRIMGPFRVSIQKKNTLTIGEDPYLILSELAGSVDTIWPRGLHTRMKLIKNIQLFNDDKLILVFESTGKTVRYLALEWNDNHWVILLHSVIVPIFPPAPAVEVELLDFNKVIYTHYKKELIEYDLDKKTEKRTPIKE